MLSRMCHNARPENHTTHSLQSSYYVPVCTCVLLCNRLVAFFNDCRVSVLMIFFRKWHLRCLSQRDIASKHTAQRRTISSAQALGTIKSLVAPNNESFFTASFTSSCVLPCAMAAGSVSRPRGRALVYFTGFPFGYPRALHVKNGVHKSFWYAWATTFGAVVRIVYLVWSPTMCLIVVLDMKKWLLFDLLLLCTNHTHTPDSWHGCCCTADAVLLYTVFVATSLSSWSWKKITAFLDQRVPITAHIPLTHTEARTYRSTVRGYHKGVLLLLLLLPLPLLLRRSRKQRG